ncbi:hypothetical protein Tco_1492453 [Tanacetum coccineum]
MTKVDSELELMPEDEIVSVSGIEDANDDDSKTKEELSKNDETAVDYVLDELVDMANTKDANLISTSKVKMGEVVGLLRETAKYYMQLISYMKQVIHSTVKVPNNILVVNAKSLTSQVNRTSTDMNELVRLISRDVQLMETSALPVNVDDEGENKAQAKKDILND